MVKFEQFEYSIDKNNFRTKRLVEIKTLGQIW